MKKPELLISVRRGIFYFFYVTMIDKNHTTGIVDVFETIIV